jgi:hypothetical protein
MRCTYQVRETDIASEEETYPYQEKRDRKEARCSYQVKRIGRTYRGICP